MAIPCWGASVSVQPYPVITTPGQTFGASYELDSDTQVRGFAVSIAYDSNVLSFVQASRGTLFANQSIGWWRVNTDTLNVLHVECLIFGAGLSVTGPGNMLNFTFNAIGGDFSSLRISSQSLYDVSGYAIPSVNRNHGAVIIGNQPAYLSARCFLQGAMDGDAMMHNLLRPHLPLNSPYPGAVQAVTDIPIDVVDWMYLELRESPNARAIATQPVFLLKDGSVCSAGKSFVVFMGLTPGDYYLVLRHRNHLAIMSAIPFGLVSSGAPGLADLSLATHVYLQSGIVPLSDGRCALAAGDADQDGGVFPSDRNEQWQRQNGTSGYRSADFNLDGMVDYQDLQLFWQGNAGLMSAVPGMLQ